VADRIDTHQIRVVAYSKFYPGWVYSARKDLDPEILKKVQDALFKLSFENSEHRKILEKADFTRIVPSNDAEFDSVRELMTLVGIDLDN
jgi:phosphonate transport system substrate-binding protein